MQQEQQVYEALEALGIAYEVFRHPAVFTVADAAEHWAGIPGRGCKNLFLRDKKGVRHFLVVVPDEKRVDIAALAEQQGLGRLSFGSPDRLMRCLGLEPGSVSPFGLINDPEGAVEVLVDQELMEEPLVTFHPNINTATVAITAEAFRIFLKSRRNPIVYVAIPELP